MSLQEGKNAAFPPLWGQGTGKEEEEKLKEERINNEWPSSVLLESSENKK